MQVTKSPKPVASCAMPVGPGMDIKTDTPLVKKAREGVMEFLLVLMTALFVNTVLAADPALCTPSLVHIVLLCVTYCTCRGKGRIMSCWGHKLLLCRSIIPWIAPSAIREGNVICKTRQCSTAVIEDASLR